jgi:hypothetical protein
MLPEAWVNKVQNANIGDSSEISEPSSYSISGISDANIEGTAQAVGDRIRLKFRYVLPKLAPSPFTFYLTDNRDDTSEVILATLDGLEMDIDPLNATVLFGKTIPLTITAIRGTGVKEPISAADITFRSADPAIAAVSWNGMVTGFKYGSTMITAEHYITGKKAERTVVVNDGVHHATITSATQSIEIGETVYPAAGVFDADGNQIDSPQGSWYWNSADHDIATVNEYGKITGVSVGSTHITAEHIHSGKQAEIEITVTDIGCTPERKAQLETAVVGNWAVLDVWSGETKHLELLPGGTGYYDTGTTQYPVSWRVAGWDEPVRIQTNYVPRTYVNRSVGLTPGCILHQVGFWHLGYEGLRRTNLLLPDLEFTTYSAPYDSTEPQPALVYTKR